MPLRVLIIGGYGNFGSHIAASLATHPGIRLLIGGRSMPKAEALIASLDPAGGGEAVRLDIDLPLEETLRGVAADLVIHTSGPFQGQDYRVAQACIAARVAYCDLADARDFVAGIETLDRSARDAGIAVISGASSVPCLTAAIVDRYRLAFKRLRSIDYGIGAAQATNRGASTTAAILSYVGQPFTHRVHGAERIARGWQGTTMVRYPELGRRLFGDCDIPDLALFPSRYPEVETIRFRAGHELWPLHVGAWMMSWAVRLGVLRSLAPHATLLHQMSLWFDAFGSGKSGFHMFLDGDDVAGQTMRIAMFIVARNAEGPNIPCIPSILIARRLASGWRPQPGARPCLDLFDLDTLIEAMQGRDISIRVEGPNVDQQWGAPWPIAA